MGSNMAEAHPVGFQWVMEAKARGTRVVHIDPRFTRTSAVADRHVPLRAGSDIAFLGGVINYILSNELDFREYVTAYTNASFIVDESFKDTEDLDGLFSGYHESGSYDPSTWHYESTEVKEHGVPHQYGSGGAPLEGTPGDIPSDPNASNTTQTRAPRPTAATSAATNCVRTWPECTRYISRSTELRAASMAASIAGKNSPPPSSSWNELPVRHGHPVVVNCSASHSAIG